MIVICVDRDVTTIFYADYEVVEVGLQEALSADRRKKIMKVFTKVGSVCLRKARNVFTRRWVIASTGSARGACRRLG